MSIKNPLQYPQENWWFAWRPVRLKDGRYAWLTKIVKRTLPDYRTSLFGQQYIAYYNEYDTKGYDL